MGPYDRINARTRSKMDRKTKFSLALSIVQHNIELNWQCSSSNDLLLACSDNLYIIQCSLLCEIWISNFESAFPPPASSLWPGNWSKSAMMRMYQLSNSSVRSWESRTEEARKHWSILNGSLLCLNILDAFINSPPPSVCHNNCNKPYCISTEHMLY